MSRLDIMTPSRSQTVIDGLYRDVERRIASSPPGLCPVRPRPQLSQAVPCADLRQVRALPHRPGSACQQLLERGSQRGTLPWRPSIHDRDAPPRVIYNSADCAIGCDAAAHMVSRRASAGFRDDYEEHILHHRCLGGMREQPVPCVALCPAGVDIPGYVALVKDGPLRGRSQAYPQGQSLPRRLRTYICEHPCEARCRRSMMDDAINIRGLKRYAVDHAGSVPNPSHCPAHRQDRSRHRRRPRRTFRGILSRADGPLK